MREPQQNRNTTRSISEENIPRRNQGNWALSLNKISSRRRACLLPSPALKLADPWEAKATQQAGVEPRLLQSEDLQEQ